MIALDRWTFCQSYAYVLLVARHGRRPSFLQIQRCAVGLYRRWSA